MKMIKVLLNLSFLLIFVSCNNIESDNFIEGSGNIETTNIIVSSQSNGKIKQIFYSEGDRVNKGDTILIIDHEILNIKLRQTQAGEKAALAKLSLAQKGARVEDILLGEEQFKQTKENYTLTAANYERMKNLYSEQVITKKQFDEVETAFRIAESQMKSAAENVKKIKNIFRPEEITQLQSNYENAQASVSLVKQQINDCHIISPLDAFIVENFTELGESVNFGSSLLKLANLSVVELEIYVNEQNLGKVKLGQNVEIKTDTYENKIYEGKVTFISPEAEFTPKNIQTKDERTKLVFAIKIEVPNEKFELKAGMPADARIKIKE